MRISYSALEIFLQCPLKFKYQQIKKIKTPKSKEAIFGTTIHSVLQMLHSPSRDVPPTSDEMLTYFSEKWDPSVYESAQEETMNFAMGVRILKDYYKKNYPSKFNVLDLETFFEAPIVENGETHYITGKIDRIDKIDGDIFEVIDYKTVKKMPSQEIINSNLQLSIYHLGLVNRWPSIRSDNRSVKTSLYFLKHGEKLSVIKTNDVLEETQNKIIKTIIEIKKTDYKPRQSALCAWCGYQSLCPIWKNKYIAEPTIDDIAVQAVIKEFHDLKEKMKKDAQRLAEIKEQVSNYYNTAKVDRIFDAEGRYLARSIKQIYAYDEPVLRDILQRINKWEEVIKIDEAKLKKVSASLPQKIRDEIKSTKKIAKEFFSITFGKDKKINSS
ncbi:MAG: hypothetical protein COU81_02720 [Candidatus Portnoybacteria bacterium CG10_big_fil_rev_8_21_14_0_10_36_7]|uniref:PD-(D/E)XK endonuclease-like domain-containing protein n=1 Tax=Candidatus Portnoybacteria bacterium CG10_big_fil_rev_8_21_14_0_10_36_7 TaxID=1974812 RepID=A0A2M8KDS0_9BACT|nr:MAG: hypothetical protein COU81_02720 [Candidatus Portnoybacteria bacterium CG10_big_fil_rev_8_21_14_0_10_36_7]